MENVFCLFPFVHCFFLKQSKCQSLCGCSYWVKPTRSSGMPVSWRMVLKFWDPLLSRCIPSFSTTSPKCSRSKRPHRRTSWVVICTNRNKETPMKKDLSLYKCFHTFVCSYPDLIWDILPFQSCTSLFFPTHWLFVLFYFHATKKPLLYQNEGKFVINHFNLY